MINMNNFGKLADALSKIAEQAPDETDSPEWRLHDAQIALSEFETKFAEASKFFSKMHLNPEEAIELRNKAKRFSDAVRKFAISPK